jgi:hypothetical protein
MGESNKKAERLALTRKLAISDRERMVLAALLLNGPPQKTKGDLRAFNRAFDRLGLAEFETAKEVKFADFSVDAVEHDMTIEGLEWLAKYLEECIKQGAITGIGARIIGALVDRIDEAAKE